MASTVASLVAAPQFAGLKAVPSKEATFSSKTSFAVSKSRTNCVVDAFPIIAGSTFGALALGRFVINKSHKAYLAKAGLPTQNGKTHAEAGDEKAVEVDLFTKTNDPEGFTLSDVLGYGALGHAVGFATLAVLNNGYVGPLVTLDFVPK